MSFVLILDIDECASNPCTNGVCRTPAVNAFQCDCDDTGYEGTLCADGKGQCQCETQVTTNNMYYNNTHVYKKSTNKYIFP